MTDKKQIVEYTIRLSKERSDELVRMSEAEGEDNELVYLENMAVNCIDGGWTSIDECPLNKRVILTFDYDSVYTGELSNDGQWFDGSYEVPTPKAWQHLPKPPKE